MNFDFNFREGTKSNGIEQGRRQKTQDNLAISGGEQMMYLDFDFTETEDNWRISGGRGADDGAKNRSLCHPGVLPLWPEYNGPALQTLRALQIGIFTTTCDYPDTDQLENHIYF